MKSKKGAVQDKNVLSVGQWLLFLARKMAYYYYHYIVLHVTRTHFCTFWSSVGWQLISWRNQRHGWIGIGETHHQTRGYVWGVGLVLHIYGCGCSINCWVARYAVNCWRYFLSRLRYWKVKYVALAILAVCHSWLPIKCVAKSACGTIDFASFS